jgi:hypothetical protein
MRFSPALPLCLSKIKAHACTLKVATDGLSAYFAFSHGMSQAV